MLIFIDTSIFCSDFWMKSISFELLKSYVNKGDNWLCLSEVVIDEVKNKYSEKITELFQRSNADIREWNKKGCTKIPFISEEQLQHEIECYNQYWDNCSFELGNGLPESYPDISHKDVVQRALERKKPFKSDGKDGYRDYLIWVTFLDVVKHHTMEDVCFITSNTRDFSDMNKKNKLHPQLEDDLINKGIDLSRVHYFVSLNSFIEKEVKPSLEVAEKHERIIGDLKANQLEFMNPLEQTLHQELLGLELAAYDIVFFEEGENHFVDEIEEIYEIEIEKVSEISSQQFLINIEAQALCDVSFFIFKGDYYGMEDFSQIFVVDSEWNEHYVLAQTIMELAISVEVIYDIDKKQIKSIEIQKVEDASADCPYCPW